MYYGHLVQDQTANIVFDPRPTISQTMAKAVSLVLDLVVAKEKMAHLMLSCNLIQNIQYKDL